jgi:uncharacterized protein (UPF0335 family)
MLRAHAWICLISIYGLGCNKRYINSEENSGVETHKMLTLKELSEKIEMLEDEKTQLLEDAKALRKEAEGKAVMLECEVAVLREEAESLRKMLETF